MQGIKILCSDCRKRPPSKGMKTCAKCRKRKRDYHIRQRDKKICPCGKPITKYTWHCNDCMLKIKENMRKLHQERRDNGFCPRCGKELNLEEEITILHLSVFTCLKCRTKNKKARLKRLETSNVQKNLQENTN